jgi:aspartate aminotransferase
MQARRNNLNARIADIPPSATLAITTRAKKMVADGIEVRSFAAGEPDFDTPDHIKQAAAKALADGKTKYSPVRGLAELGAAISEKLAAENGLHYDASQIVVSNGAKHSLFNVILALCSEGDEVIIPEPYWLSYPQMVGVAGGRPVFVPAKEENGYKVTASDLEAVATERTKALIINTPSNPTGAVYSRDELAAIAEVAQKKDFLIISDEIYEKIIYEGVPHVSIGSLSEDALKRTITVNGFSKAYSMTGWRLGYCAAPSEIAAAITAFQSHSTSGANTFAQYGALAALGGDQECVSTMLAAFTERRTYLHERLSSISGVSCVKPMGAFYMLPNVSACGLDSTAFATRLLEEQKVAVVPGVAFGADANVRLSYACSMETIEQGMNGLESFVSSL